MSATEKQMEATTLLWVKCLGYLVDYILEDHIGPGPATGYVTPFPTTIYYPQVRYMGSKKVVRIAIHPPEPLTLAPSQILKP